MSGALMRRSAVTTFWVVVSTLMAITALVGFWPTYFGPLVAGTLETQPLVHFHGAVFMAWIALFTVQASLASRGHIALHRKVGKVGMAYGVLLIVVGVVTTFNELANRIAAGAVELAHRGLLAPFTNMIVFTIFFGAAIAYRRKTEIHKRFMLLATVMLLIAAVLRMPLGDPRSMPVFLGVWLAPVLIAMIYDYATRRMVHPVYVLGLVSLTIVSFRYLLIDSDLWMSIARRLSTLVS